MQTDASSSPHPFDEERDAGIPPCWFLEIEAITS
jgi:hypothetical protein